VASVADGRLRGKSGRRLDTTFNLNQPIPGPTSTASRRPYFGIRPNLSDVTWAVSDGLSNYSAFQLTVEKSHGLVVLLGYAWGHIIDDTGNAYGGGTGTPQAATGVPTAGTRRSISGTA